MFHVGGAEAVERLFGVAHHEAGVALREVVHHKGFEVLPLQARGILKLVDEDMAVAGAAAFEDEVVAFFAQGFVYLAVEFGEGNVGGLILYFLQYLAGLPQQGQCIDRVLHFLDDEIGGVVGMA